jgi:hypothetical protein
MSGNTGVSGNTVWHFRFHLIWRAIDLESVLNI